MRRSRALALATLLALWAVRAAAADLPRRPAAGPPGEPVLEDEPDVGPDDGNADRGDDDTDDEQAIPSEPRLRRPERPIPRGEGEEEPIPAPPGEGAPVAPGPAEPARAAEPLSPG